MKRLLRRIVFLLLARLARRQAVQLVRRWLLRRMRRTGIRLGRPLLRRGMRTVVAGTARVIDQSPLRHVPWGERLILRLVVLAEQLGDHPAPRDPNQAAIRRRARAH